MHVFNECLIFHVRYDVGFVDVVIFDCYICFSDIKLLCINLSMFFYVYFNN